MENTGLQLSDLKVNNLPELQGWKEKQEKLVSENPFVEITDNKTYEVACKRRTALLKGRTELEKQVSNWKNSTRKWYPQNNKSRIRTGMESSKEASNVTVLSHF